MAGSQDLDMDLAGVVAALEALDLEHAPPAVLAALLAACSAAAGRIAARLALAPAEAPAQPAVGPETFVSVKAAATRLGVAPKWLYCRKKTLPFMRELGPGTWRVAGLALERWMHHRGRRGP
jgi:hypothetical protein